MSSVATFSSPPNSVRVVVRSDEQIAEAATTEVRLWRDVCPLTDFRTGSARIIKKVRAMNRPMVLTQHGRSTAVLLGIEAYESLIDEIELLRDVRDAEDTAAAGRLSEQSRVETRLRAINGR